MKNRKKDFLVELTTKQMNVTGSENLLRFKDKFEEENLILIDCGMLQELNINSFSKENIDFQFDIKNVRAVFITHAHNDHVAKLPFLIKEGYEGKIYMSKETSLFLENVLLDNLKIHREEAKKQNKKPLYDEGHIQRVIDLVETVEYKKEHTISLKGINVEFAFYRNNHILGASSIYMKIGYKFNQIHYLFSGDYNVANELLKKKLHLPKKAIQARKINIIVESTYGATRREEKTNFNDFEEQIREAVLNKKKVVIAIKHTYTYAGILKKNFKPSGLIEVFDDGTRVEAMGEKNTIILATAGMMSNGPVVEYMKRLLPDENTKFIIVSYCAEGTVGRKIMEKVAYIENVRKSGKKEFEIDKVINLFGKEILVNADVEKVTSLSTHARQQELLNFIKNFNRKNISSILLNHGEEIVREKFKRTISEELNIDEDKIHLYDKRNKFVFSKHGLEKKVPVQEKNQENQKTNEKCNEKEVIKRKYSV